MIVTPPPRGGNRVDDRALVMLTVRLLGVVGVLLAHGTGFRRRHSRTRLQAMTADLQPHLVTLRLARTRAAQRRLTLYRNVTDLGSRSPTPPGP